MTPILTLKPLRLAFLVLLSLALLSPTASAQITLSETEAIPSDTIAFSGSVYALTCQNGNAYLRMLLKEPGGRYRTDVKFSYSRNAAFVPPNIVDLSFDVSGSIDIEDSWPNGEYELISDVIYACSGQNWITRGDRLESVKFGVSGNSGPEDNVWQLGGSTIVPPVSQAGTFTKTFRMSETVQASLKVSAYQSASCYVNGQLAASGITSQRTIDITSYLMVGQNTVSCDVSAGYEKICGVDDGGACGCSCNRKFTQCLASGQNWDCPPNVIKTNNRIYVPAIPSFDASISTHRPTDILWSNDNVNWYYGELPMQSDSWWLEKPNFYNSDETIYTGIRPWSSSQLYLRKWFFKEPAPEGDTQWLDFSSTSALSCTINGQEIEMSENDDDWWLYNTEVTSLPSEIRLDCTSPQNSVFNIFDVRFFQESPFAAPPAEPPGTPFAFDGGSSSSSPSATGWMSQSVSGLQSAASAIPAVPLAGIATAIGAVGATNYLLSRKRFGSNGGAASYWARVSQLGQRYKERLESIARNNESWTKLKEDLRQKELKERQAAETSNAISFLSCLTGTAAERASKITSALRSGQFSSEQTIRMLNQTVSQYENITLNATMLGIHNMTNTSTGEKNETSFIESAKDALSGFAAWAADGLNTVKGWANVLWNLYNENSEKIEPFIEFGEDAFDVMFSEPFQYFSPDTEKILKERKECKSNKTGTEATYCVNMVITKELERTFRKNIFGTVRDSAYMFHNSLAIVRKKLPLVDEILVGSTAGVWTTLATYKITTSSTLMGTTGAAPLGLPFFMITPPGVDIEYVINSPGPININSAFPVYTGRVA